MLAAPRPIVPPSRTRCAIRGCTGYVRPALKKESRPYTRLLKGNAKRVRATLAGDPLEGKTLLRCDKCGGGTTVPA